MKRAALLFAVLALSACNLSPAANPADPATALLDIDRLDGKAIVTFAAGQADAQAVKLTLSGLNLAVNDPNCKAEGAQLVCTLGAVPAGRMYVLPSRGVLVAEASYQRPDGAAFSLTAE